MCECVCRTYGDIEARFERDAAEWEDQSEYMSVVIDMITVPSYQRIIGLGPAAVPLIIERMREHPGHWFWALVHIVGEDMAAGTTTVPEATRRWIEWYDNSKSASDQHPEEMSHEQDNRER